MILDRNRSNQKVGAQLINASTGAAFSGAVTVYVTGDGGTQTQGSVGAGLCTHEGHGYYTYAPSQAETNFRFISFTFVGSGALTVSIPVTTEPIVKNQANQVIGAQLSDASTGAAFTGAVTVYITGDAGTQAIGSVGSGLCTHEGNGLHTYLPSQAETNYDLIAFTFDGTGAIPITMQVATVTAAQASALSSATAVNTVTARGLIKRALKRIGVVGAGQEPSPEDMADAFGHFNTMLDGFAIERLMIPCIVRTTWTIVSGTGTYTVGDGGDVDIARPAFVKDVRFIDTSQDPDLEMPLGMLTDQGYANVPQKAATGRYPIARYFNPTFTGTGFATITLVPVPTSSTLEGVLYVPTALTQVASLDTTLVLQPGYRGFLQESLAVFCGPEWGVPVPQELRESARELKGNIKRTNIRLIEQATFEGYAFGRGGYDIHSDS